jgi:hypothetical protein
MQGVRQNRKLLPLDEREKQYISHHKFRVVFFDREYHSYLFNITDLMLHKHSMYLGNESEGMDEIDSLFLYGEGRYRIDWEHFYWFLENEELHCAKKEMYNLAFNLKNIRENIQLYKEYFDNQV